MSNPTDHELNAHLALWAGMPIEWRSDLECWVKEITFRPGSDGEQWNPLVDHNQMALVEAGLRKAGWTIYVNIWTNTCLVVNAYEVDNETTYARSEAPDKLRAMALAVWELGEPKEKL